MKLLKTKNLLLACAAALPLIFASCGEQVSIPPAHKGKVVSNDGVETELRGPSTFRLPVQFSGDAYLLLAEVSDASFKEEVQLFMPKDDLNLQFEIRGITSVPASADNLNPVFEKITSSPTNDDRVKIISNDKIYTTYVQQVVRTAARAVVGKYSIEEVMAKRDEISLEMFTAVEEGLANAPISVSRLALADIQPPQVVVTAQETRKQREIAIDQAEAEKQVSLAEAEAKFEVAKKEQEIALLEAETQVMVEEKLSGAVSPAYIIQRSLKNFEALASNPNVKMIIPTEALTNPAVMIGVNQEMLRNMDAAALSERSATLPE